MRGCNWIGFTWRWSNHGKDLLTTGPIQPSTSYNFPPLLPQSLLVHNSSLLVCLLWCLALPASQEPVLLCLAINLLSILLDIIVLAIHYPRFALMG